MGPATQASSPPTGEPRFVATFYQPTSGWRIAAEATTREPVDYAITSMIPTVQSRGQSPLVEVWGPSDDGRSWQHLNTISAQPGTALATDEPEEEATTGRTARDERLRDRCHQVLMAALGTSGIADLEEADTAAIAQLIDTHDENTVRRIAYWLSAANAPDSARGSLPN